MSDFGNIPPFYTRSTFGTSLAAIPAAASAVLTDKVVNVTTGGVAQTETLQQILTLFDATVHAFTATARAAGVAAMFTVTVPADTLRTASTEAVQILLDASASQQWATGALALQREVLVKAPTLAFVGASVVANAVTLAVDGPPLPGANATLTKTWAATFGPIANSASAQATGTQVGIFGAGVTQLIIQNSSASTEAIMSAISGGVVFGAAGVTPVLFQTNGSNRLQLTAQGKIIQTSGVATGSTADYALTPAAETLSTASTERNIFRIDTATRGWATTGTVALQRDYLFSAITYASASASQTFTTAATLAISGAPIQGTNAIITKAYALLVQAGDVNLAGSGSALATNATTGFPHLPTCAGTPTGVPAALMTGAAPMILDTSGSKIWVYIGGAWKGVAVA